MSIVVYERYATGNVGVTATNDSPFHHINLISEIDYHDLTAGGVEKTYTIEAGKKATFIAGVSTMDTAGDIKIRSHTTEEQPNDDTKVMANVCLYGAS